jgi:hypothetical protein
VNQNELTLHQNNEEDVAGMMDDPHNLWKGYLKSERAYIAYNKTIRKM